MIICSKCGHYNNDYDNECCHCGADLKMDQMMQLQAKNNDHSVAALICAFFIPIVGLILGVISYNVLKHIYDDGSHKSMALAAIIISVIYMALSIISSIIGLVFYSFIIFDDIFYMI